MKRLFLSLVVLAATAALVWAAPAPAAAEPAPAPASKGMAAVLEPFVKSHTLAGAVTLVASQDKVLGLEAVGYADIAAGKPMRTDSLFWIASMSKPMTATALMMLVDEGKVRVDDPVEKYLPEFQGQMVVAERDNQRVVLKPPAHPITVKNILSHTSGLPYMTRLEHKIDTFPLDEAAVIYALTPLKFEPDSKYEYSNAGINTVGRIIEVAGGMPYEKFMDERLFKPLGMKDTTFWPSEEQLRRLAKSYKPDADQKGLVETAIGYFAYPLSNRRRSPCPAGGLFSTAGDVSIFCRMILGGGVYGGKRYISEEALRQMTSTQTGNLLSKGQGDSGYGFGWFTSRAVHGKSDPVIVGGCGHSGAYGTDMWIDPETRLITVYLIQHAGFPGKDGPKILPAFKKAAADAFAIGVITPR
ncbi:MAG: serine hydrolase domain-containing protein [Thermoguttaceae bacterium]|jgi:CubicO group peptidase (beta-lactamase class C family)